MQWWFIIVILISVVVLHSLYVYIKPFLKENPQKTLPILVLVLVIIGYFAKTLIETFGGTF